MPNKESRTPEAAPDRVRVDERLQGRPDQSPGQRAALPRGTLKGPAEQTQSDENREPPGNAPLIPD